jgi:PhzF family phenazine biosynthesis protein
MQALAAENNQSETAFLRQTGAGQFDLRWFTPTMEVPLCGHATLAAAHVLFDELGEGPNPLCFETRSGPLRVERAGGAYTMDFPADPPRKAAPFEALEAALGTPVQEVFLAQYLVAIVDSPERVRALRPDMAALARLGAESGGGAGNIVVAAAAEVGSAVDVVDRFFAPGSGIPEDPATGSAHCILAPLFSDRLGRAELTFWQAYPGRGASIRTRLVGERVLLMGHAVTVGETSLRLKL